MGGMSKVQTENDTWTAALFNLWLRLRFVQSQHQTSEPFTAMGGSRLKRRPTSLAADGAIACFSSNLFPLLKADRAPQQRPALSG